MKLCLGNMWYTVNISIVLRKLSGYKVREICIHIRLFLNEISLKNKGFLNGNTLFLIICLMLYWGSFRKC